MIDFEIRSRVVTIDGKRMTVRAIGEDATGGIRDVVRQVLPSGTSSDPIVVEA